jgi:hypothetical protein
MPAAFSPLICPRARFAILSGVFAIPLAHVGHWWGYVLYAVPALIVLFATVQSLIAQRRERRAQK